MIHPRSLAFFPACTFAMALGGGVSVGVAATAESVSSACPVESIVAEVLTNSPELGFYRAGITAAKAGRKSAGQWKNPEITTELGSKRAWERGGGRTLGDGLAWSVSVAQNFEWPGRIALRKAIANAQVELAELGLAQFEAALAVRARKLAISALSRQQQADATREVASRYQSVIEALVQREPAGPTPLLEQRVIEAAALTLQRRLTQLQRELQASLLELNQLRGKPAASALRLTGDLAVETNLPPVSVLLQAAYDNNFELRMRRAELEQQGFQIKLAHNERYPSLTLAPFYSSEKAADEERIAGVGLSLPLPLWNSGGANVEAANARLQQAETAWLVACRELERKVSDHALALEALSVAVAQAGPDRMERFAEAAELADRHYRMGAVPLSTYLQMQDGYLDALDALIATRQEALEHRQELSLLAGRPLEQPGAPASN